MNRVGVFVDVGNQFFTINKKWEGRKLDYEAYKAKASTFGTVVRAFAYGTQIENSAAKFIACLHHFGYEPQYKSIERNNWYSWDVGMAMDMVRVSDKIDVAVVGSSSRSIAPALQYLREKGIRVVVLGCGINKDVKEACDQWIEITEEMLEGINEKEVEPVAQES